MMKQMQTTDKNNGISRWRRFNTIGIYLLNQLFLFLYYTQKKPFQFVIYGFLFVSVYIQFINLEDSIGKYHYHKLKMKAFDTISPSYYEKQKSLQQIPKRSYFLTEKKQVIEVPYNAQVQVKAISQELRKPRFHVIKARQPNVHILQSKGKGVIGVDTGMGVQVKQLMDVSVNNSVGGLFGIFGNANVFQTNNSQLKQENIQNQQHLGKSRNPFELLKKYLWKQPQHQTISQQLFPMGYGVQSNMTDIQQQQRQQHRMQISDHIDHLRMQNMQQSQVRQVELSDIRASFPQSLQPNQTLVDRFLNIFKSPNPNSKTQSQQENQQIKVVSKSQVQLLQQLNELKKEIENKNIFEESIVQQYHQGK